VWSLFWLTACASSSATVPVGEQSARPHPGSPSSSAAPEPSATSSAFASESPTAKPVTPTAHMIEPAEPGAVLVQSEPSFDAVRKGKPLQLGSKGPAVRIVQTMLASWNYALEVPEITGTFDQRTAAAVLAYRIDTGLSEIPAAGTFEQRAKTEGRFDAKALRMFEDRVAAKANRALRSLDEARGLRFHVGAGATAASALAAMFPDEAARKRASIAMPVLDTSDAAAVARGEVVVWLPIQAYVCGTSSRASDCGM